MQLNSEVSNTCYRKNGNFIFKWVCRKYYNEVIKN